MKIKTFLFFFILGFHPQSSSAAFINFKKQKNNPSQIQISVFPLEIMEFITSYLIKDLYQTAENHCSPPSSVRNDVINIALINKNFYQSTLQAIFNHFRSDDFFKKTIHHKDENLKKLIASCKDRKGQAERILFPPLITAIGFKDQINEEEETLLKELIPFCQYICVLSFENLEIQKEKITPLIHLAGNFHRVRSLKFFDIQFFNESTAINQLIKMIAYFKNLEEFSLIRSQIQEEKSFILAKLPMASKKLKKLSFCGSLELSNIFLKLLPEASDYHNLEELDLSQSNLLPTFIHNLNYLKQPIRLNFSENPKIRNCLFPGVFSESACSTLKFLDLSFTRIQSSDLEGLSRLKSLTHLVLSYCPKVEVSFIKELSQCKNIVKTLQILNLSNNPQIKFNHDLMLDLSKFKNLQQLILNKNHQIQLNFFQGLKKEIPKLEIVYDQLINRSIEFSYFKKNYNLDNLISFIPSIFIIYSNSELTHLLENYLPPIYSKILSNSLKSFYVFIYCYLLTKKDFLKSSSIYTIFLLCTINAVFVFFEIKAFHFIYFY